MEAAIEKGYRHFDTAIMYKTEEAVGNAIKKAIDGGIPREEFFITTKVWFTHIEDPIGQLQESLERMHLDYVDLCLVHWPLPPKDENGRFKKLPMHKIWAEFEKMVASNRESGLFAIRRYNRLSFELPMP